MQFTGTEMHMFIVELLIFHLPNHHHHLPIINFSRKYVNPNGWTMWKHAFNYYKILRFACGGFELVNSKVVLGYNAYQKCNWLLKAAVSQWVKLFQASHEHVLHDHCKHALRTANILTIVGGPKQPYSN